MERSGIAVRVQRLVMCLHSVSFLMFLKFILIRIVVEWNSGDQVFIGVDFDSFFPHGFPLEILLSICREQPSDSLSVL